MEKFPNLDAKVQKYLDLVLKNIPIEGKNVLEIGCGSGSLCRALLQHNPLQITGIDYALTTRWKETEISDKRLTLREADACNLDIPDSSIDSIYSINVFEHIDNLKSALGEIGRVLKPGGKVFTIFSPIWTSRDGHHYKHWIEDIRKHIPPWGHLFLSKQELQEAILKSSKDEALAEKASKTIFHRKGLNRLSYSEYLNLFDFARDEYSLKFKLKESKDKKFEDYFVELQQYPGYQNIKGLDVRGFIGTITKMEKK